MSYDEPWEDVCVDLLFLSLYRQTDLRTNVTGPPSCRVSTSDGQLSRFVDISRRLCNVYTWVGTGVGESHRKLMKRRRNVRGDGREGTDSQSVLFPNDKLVP